MNRAEILIAATCIVFAAVLMGILASEHTECRNAGGDLVRTIMWVTCIK